MVIVRDDAGSSKIGVSACSGAEVAGDSDIGGDIGVAVKKGGNLNDVGADGGEGENRKGCKEDEEQNPKQVEGGHYIWAWFWRFNAIAEDNGGVGCTR